MKVGSDSAIARESILAKRRAMSDSGQTRPELTEVIETLLHEVAHLPDILFVMGKGPRAVMEGWVTPDRTRVILQDKWIAVESEAWHCHLHCPDVRDIRFLEEPDVHDPRRQAFSNRFLGQDGQPLLMIFFGGMYDETGALLHEKVARFRTLGGRTRMD